MKMYYVENVKTGKHYKIQAQTVNDLKKIMIEKCPNGKYSVMDDAGRVFNDITINQYSRPVIPKEDYDNLYFYVTERGQEMINDGERTPPQVSSPRRYNTINDVRKSALAKSYANYKNAQHLKAVGMERYISSNDSVILYIYKGSLVLGMVYCSPLAKPPYKGTGVYVEYVRHKDSIFIMGRNHRLLKDGSIERM